MCSNSLICGCNSPVNDAIGSLKHLHVMKQHTECCIPHVRNLNERQSFGHLQLPVLILECSLANLTDIIQLIKTNTSNV